MSVCQHCYLIPNDGKKTWQFSLTTWQEHLLIFLMYKEEFAPLPPSGIILMGKMFEELFKKTTQQKSLSRDVDFTACNMGTVGQNAV